MITTWNVAVPSVRTRKSLPLRLFQTLADLPARLTAHRLKHRQIKALYRMSDRQLTDIGLTRGDLTFALSLPLGSDPAQKLQQLTRERRASEQAMARENLRGLEAARRAAGYNH